MLVDCQTCKFIDKCDQEDRWYGCINYKSRPQTNADRIRAMSDDELVNFLYEVQEEIRSSFDERDFSYAYKYPFRKRTWLDWLKQEINE